ncbi:MAG: S-layer homology domain-containing protein [Eubacteriales bacterium]|nr:S-layer homology domain-containing protein [Eubacteriales bacterium]
MRKKWSRLVSAFLALFYCAALTPAAVAADTSVRPIVLNTVARERSDGRYDVTYTASLTMGEQFAKIVALNKNDESTLKELRFVCTLTDDLVKQLDSVKETDFTFSGPGSSNFSFEEVKKDGTGSIQITYKLDENEINSWGTKPVEDVKEHMDKLMTMTAAKIVTAEQLENAKNTDRKILTNAKVDIKAKKGGDIPFYGESTILAAEAQNVLMTIVPYHSGGSNKYPVYVEEEKHGSVDTNYKQAENGIKVTVTPAPDKGYRVGDVIVTDKDGNRLKVTDNGDGTYSFIMPKSAVYVEAIFVKDFADPANTGVADILNTDDHIVYMVGYNNGNFGPQDDVTRCQVAMIFYRLLKNQNAAVTASFKDVPEHIWYERAVNTLASLGIVNGVGNDKFEPERAITRAEFSAIAVRFAKSLAESDMKFSDVPESFWAYDYINTAAAFGWVDGIGNNRFAPNDKISRAQVAAIVNRMTGRMADQTAVDRGEGRQFPDVSKNYWAWYDISEATTAHDYTKSNGLEHWKNVTSR